MSAHLLNPQLQHLANGNCILGISASFPKGLELHHFQILHDQLNYKFHSQLCHCIRDSQQYGHYKQDILGQFRLANLVISSLQGCEDVSPCDHTCRFKKNKPLISGLSKLDRSGLGTTDFQSYPELIQDTTGLDDVHQDQYHIISKTISKDSLTNNLVGLIDDGNSVNLVL